MMTSYSVPLIAHVIHRLNVGGLENGLVNLINHLPDEKYRHAIICLTESSDFVKRIRRNDVVVYELHKKQGKDPIIYFRLWKLLRKISPAIVHTRNISTLETSVIAWLAGVPVRIHGEHGRDIYDLHGKHKRYQKLRRICAPFINQFIAVSQDLADWLVDEVTINKNKIVQLYNGVDADLFHPTGEEKKKRQFMPADFTDPNSIIIGTVGRLEPVKDQLTLVRAFIELVHHKSELSGRLRLVLLGDGSLRSEIEELLSNSGVQRQVWLAGSQDNVPDILRDLDIFVLPSLGEGISNTILEAMACGLPVVATNVGGNSELVEEAITGTLVPANEPVALAGALNRYIRDRGLIQSHGAAGRRRVEELFSLSSMMRRYQSVYDSLLMAKGL